MKQIKFLAIALIALSVLASCKKEPKTSETASLRLSIESSELRALQDPIANETSAQAGEWKDMKVFLYAGDQIVAVQKHDDAAIKAVTSGETTTFIYPDVPATVNKVKVEANTKTEKGIESYQVTTLPDFQKLPIAGEAEVTAVAGNDKEMEASVSLKPLLARFEVSGKVNPAKFPLNATAGNKTAWKSVTVQAVAMNNILVSSDATERTLLTTTLFTEGLLREEPTAADKDAFANKAKVAGWQLFPGTATNGHATEKYDHLVIKYTAELTDEAKAAGLTYPTEPRYLNIVDFKQEDTLIDFFKAGNIYKMDIDDIAQFFTTDGNGNPVDPGTTTPDTPDAKKKLTVKVKVAKWTAVNIKPGTIKQ